MEQKTLQYINTILGFFKDAPRREAICRFHELVKSHNNANETTRLSYLRFVNQLFLLASDKGVSVADIDSELCYELMGSFKNRDTRRSCAIAVRLYLRLMSKKEEAEKIVLPKVKRNKLPEALTENEILKVIKKCDDMRDRAILWFSYETGARSHEVRNVRIEDVKFDDKGARVLVRSNKSESRPLRFIFSVPSLQTWLNQHKDRDNPKAFLFYGRKNKLTTSALLKIVQKRVKKAGIGKHVTHHIFGRHSCFAKLKKERKLSDSMLLMRAGVRTRKWIDRYGKLHPHEVDKACLEAYGHVEVEEEPKAQILEPKPCPRIIQNASHEKSGKSSS